MKNISQEDGVHVLERGIVTETAKENQNYQGYNIAALNEANEYKIVKHNDNNGEYHEPIQIHGGVTWENDDFMDESAFSHRRRYLSGSRCTKTPHLTWDEDQGK